MKLTHIFAAFSLLAFASCSASQYINQHSSFSKTNPTACNGKQKRVTVLLEGEKTDFKYTTIGVVETIGNDQSSNQDMLAALQYEAWSNCANAIINVKTAHTLRKDESSIGDILASVPPTYSNAKILSGVAIRIEDADLPNSIPNTIDTAFAVQHRNTLTAAVKAAETGTTFTIITTMLASTIYVIARPKN